MLFELLRWWYGPGYLKVWREAGQTALKVEKAFSVGVLLLTLFSPWKRILTIPGSSVGERFRAGIDNLVSRAVGFFARLFALLAAMVITTLAGLLGFLVAAAWPLLPPVLVYLIFKGVIG